MAEFPAPKTSYSNAEVVPRTPPASGGLLAYALFGTAAAVALISHGFPFAAPFMGIIGIAGLIVAYVKRDEAQGTWVESHLRWLIRTFWWSFFWAVIGGIVFVLLFIVFLLGPILAWFIWGAASIWVLYRVIRGYLLFKDEKPVPGM
jgi:uncharacterized membrane protein